MTKDAQNYSRYLVVPKGEPAFTVWFMSDADTMSGPSALRRYHMRLSACQRNELCGIHAEAVREARVTDFSFWYEVAVKGI